MSEKGEAKEGVGCSREGSGDQGVQEGSRRRGTGEEGKVKETVSNRNWEGRGAETRVAEQTRTATVGRGVGRVGVGAEGGRGAEDQGQGEGAGAEELLRLSTSTSPGLRGASSDPSLPRRRTTL